MRNQQSRVLATVQAVQGFLDTHADIVGAVTDPSRSHLDEVEKDLSAFAQAQVGASNAAMGEMNNQRTIRLALRNDHMRPIAEIAKLKLRDVPNFTSLVMPPGNATSTQLVTHARAMANEARKYADVFTSVGLHADFITRLESVADSLEASVTVRKGYVDRSTGATAGLATEEGRARKLIRLLDALVRPGLRNNDALTREWAGACHVPKKSGIVQGSASSAPGSTTAGSATGATTQPASGGAVPPATQPASTTGTAPAA